MNILISAIEIPFIGKVFDDGFYWGAIETIKEIDERMYFKFKSNNVNEVAILALYAGEKPLGAIGISFCGQNRWTPPLSARLFASAVFR